MDKEIESVIDYYILYRDIGKPKEARLHGIDGHGLQSEDSKGYRLSDFMIGGAFLWCYIGKLTARQARGIQVKLDLELETRFEQQANRLPQHVIEHLRNISRRLKLDGTEEGLVARTPWKDEDFSGFVAKAKIRVPLTWSSFVRLLPLPTLTDIWHRVGCPIGVEPLPSTAITWYHETLCGQKISLVGQKFCPEGVEIAFKSSIDDQEMTESQREILWKCVEIANRVRKADGGSEDTNIKKKKYRLEHGRRADTKYGISVCGVRR